MDFGPGSDHLEGGTVNHFFVQRVKVLGNYGTRSWVISPRHQPTTEPQPDDGECKVKYPLFMAELFRLVKYDHSGGSWNGGTPYRWMVYVIENPI